MPKLIITKTKTYSLQDRTFNLSKKKYRSKLALHSKINIQLLTVNKLAIQNKWMEMITIDKNAVAELGEFRHFNIYCNYDTVLDKICSKWDTETPIFCRDIISNVRNRVNRLILIEILVADRLYREYNL